MPEMVALEQMLCRSAPWRFWTRKYVLPWALQGMRPSGEGLEIGAGSGLMAAGLLDAFPDLELTVTDYDTSMLKAARGHLNRFGPRARLDVADAAGLSFADGSFDYVFSFIMHHVVGWEKAIAEALRVLRPGGWLVGYDVLNSVALRLFHRIEGAKVRLMRLGELYQVVDALPIDRAVLTRTAGMPLVRFRIRKKGA